MYIGGCRAAAIPAFPLTFLRSLLRRRDSGELSFIRHNSVPAWMKSWLLSSRKPRAVTTRQMLSLLLVVENQRASKSPLRLNQR